MGVSDFAHPLYTSYIYQKGGDILAYAQNNKRIPFVIAVFGTLITLYFNKAIKKQKHILVPSIDFIGKTMTLSEAEQRWGKEPFHHLKFKKGDENT